MRVLIAGGGVAALEAALALQARAAERVEVELVAPESEFSYRPLAVAEPFALGEVHRFDLAELAAAAGATFTRGRLVRVDVERHVAHDGSGASHDFDVLLVACGTVPVEAVRGGFTFRGPADTARFRELLQEIRAGAVERVVFAVSWGAAWSLPIYELALMTATWLGPQHHAELRLLTPEEEPLQLFGRAGSDAVRQLLEERGIALQTRAAVTEFVDGHVHLIGEDPIPADRVVAMPRLQGPRIHGLPQTVEGFLPVDLSHCRVQRVRDVFAAGDVTSFPIKQGGIATQQADAAADAIAKMAGADVEPEPFRPVLRGLLLTGRQSRYLRQEFGGGAGDLSISSPEPLWWPPAKIVGRYLAPFLAARAALPSPPEQPSDVDGVAIEVELEQAAIERLAAANLPRAEPGDGGTVGDAMVREPLVVPPDQTLGELAEEMVEQEKTTALVTEADRLIGIVRPRDLLHASAARVDPRDARVLDWMTAEPVAITEGTPIEAAVTLMAEYGFDQLPVVAEGRPVGLLRLEEAARQVRTRAGIGLGF